MIMQLFWELVAIAFKLLMIVVAFFVVGLIGQAIYWILFQTIVGPILLVITVLAVIAMVISAFTDAGED